MQAFSGIMLSLHYVPDGGAAEVRPGVPGAIHAGPETLVRHGDTIAFAHQPVLAEASSEDAVPSGAAASVFLTIEEHVVGGALLRALHTICASLLIISLVLLVILLALDRGWLQRRGLWLASVLGVVVVLVSAYTGRLLPDDVYAYISGQIVRHELAEFPLGGMVTSMLGLNASAQSRLSMPFAMHAILLPVMLTVGLCLFWRWFSRPSLLAVALCAISIALGIFLLPGTYPVHDVLHGTQTDISATPWWPFVVPNAAVSWLGAELAGYLGYAILLALLALPFMGRRND